MNAAKRIGVALTLWVLASPAFAATDLPPTTETDQQIERASKLFEEGHSLDARKIYESLLPALRNRAPSSKLGYVLNAMSKIVAADGNYSDSIQLAEQSAQVYRQIGDVGGESHALNNKAIAELQNGSYPGARQDLEQELVLRWVEEIGQRPGDDDPRRRYYRLSSLGRGVLTAETARLASVVREARLRLQVTKPRRA